MTGADDLFSVPGASLRAAREWADAMGYDEAGAQIGAFKAFMDENFTEHLDEIAKPKWQRDADAAFQAQWVHLVYVCAVLRGAQPAVDALWPAGSSNKPRVSVEHEGRVFDDRNVVYMSAAELCEAYPESRAV